jgi:putative ABC transport system permease protein
MNMDDKKDDNNQPNDNGKGGMRDLWDKATTAPTDTSLDVSITSETALQLLEITAAICIVSVILPSVYILRLSPREILVKKEA